MKHGTETGDFVFMPDIAKTHITNLTKQSLQANGNQLLEWPVKSPDVKPVENVWGTLLLQIYKNGFQFETANDLTNAASRAWSEINSENLEILNISTTKR